MMLMLMLVRVYFRAKRNSKRAEAAAAIAIQRRQRQLVQARVESARAQREVARRRWAVDKLHAAYAKKWRFEVAARRDRRRKFEQEEEVRFLFFCLFVSGVVPERCSACKWYLGVRFFGSGGGRGGSNGVDTTWHVSKTAQDYAVILYLYVVTLFVKVFVRIDHVARPRPFL